MTLIAKNIRWFRKQQQISQTEFASIFGITRASVGAYEEGRAEPKLELISRFAKYYNVDLTSFIDVDLSLSNSDQITINRNTTIDTTGKMSNTTSSPTSSFVQEILETTTSKNAQDEIRDTKNKIKNIESNKDGNKQIILYKSAKEYVHLDQSQWPFFQGCDAVFECTPHLERERLYFRDGMFFICVKVIQTGLYNGVFIEQDRNRLRLIEGDLNVLEGDKKVWRILYTIDSINSVLKR